MTTVVAASPIPPIPPPPLGTNIYGILPYGAAKEIVEKRQVILPWLTNEKVYYMIRKLNSKDAIVPYNKGSCEGSSTQDNSNCFPSALSTLTPASTDVVNNMEDMCAADHAMIAILNGDKYIANSIVTTRTAVVTTEASSSTVGGGRPKDATKVASISMSTKIKHFSQLSVDEEYKSVRKESKQKEMYSTYRRSNFDYFAVKNNTENLPITF